MPHPAQDRAIELAEFRIAIALSARYDEAAERGAARTAWAPDEAAAVGGRGGTLPLQAMEDGAGAVIRLRGPQLPNFRVQR